MIVYCVYEIRHILTRKVYIGMTGGSFRRFQQHIELLRKGRHHSPDFQAAWDASLGVTEWAFRFLTAPIEDKQTALEAEASHINAEDPSLLLNGKPGRPADYDTVQASFRMSAEAAQILREEAALKGVSPARWLNEYILSGEMEAEDIWDQALNSTE